MECPAPPQSSGRNAPTLNKMGHYQLWGELFSLLTSSSHPHQTPQRWMKGQPPASVGRQEQNPVRCVKDSWPWCLGSARVCWIVLSAVFSKHGSGTMLVFNKCSSGIMHKRPRAGWDPVCSSPKEEAWDLTLVLEKPELCSQGSQSRGWDRLRYNYGIMHVLFPPFPPF